MTLNDLPTRNNIKIVNSPVFEHTYFETDYNIGVKAIGLKKKLVSVNTFKHDNKLPIIEDNYNYFFYSIDEDEIRYAKVEISAYEKRLIRKKKLEKLSEMF